MVAITSLLAIGAAAVSTVYGSPAGGEAGCKVYQKDIKQLSHEVPHVKHFCESYQKSQKKTSAVKGFTPKKLHKTCECLDEPTVSNKLIITTSARSNGGISGSIAGQAAASVCKNVNLARVLSGIKDVKFFCQRFNPSQWARGSPIFGSTTSAISQACSCVLNSTTPTSTTSGTAISSATPSSSPFSFGSGFNFCPSSTSELSHFKAFCFTPLWKFWSCSCNTVAQVCFPTTSLSWCPHSSHGSSSTTTISVATSSVAFTDVPTTSSTDVPVTTTTNAAAAATTTSTDDGSSASSTTTADGSSPTPDNSGTTVSGQFAVGPAVRVSLDLENELGF